MLNVTLQMGFETVSIHSWDEITHEGKPLFTGVAAKNIVLHILRL